MSVTAKASQKGRMKNPQAPPMAKLRSSISMLETPGAVFDNLAVEFGQIDMHLVRLARAQLCHGEEFGLVEGFGLDDGLVVAIVGDVLVH